jgi:hypothetical protein
MRDAKTRTRDRARRLAAAASLLLVPALLGGCLDAPGIEETWTRVDFARSSLAPFQNVTLGSTPAVTVGADITYRSILTGVVVAELRASSTLSPATLRIDPKAPRLQMAQDIDRLLASSVTLGRATRAVTGWDHLIQHIDFTFTGAIPSVVDSAGTGTGGVFLVCYLGAGERMELANGDDTLLVTPFVSTDKKILPLGLSLTPIAGP